MKNFVSSAYWKSFNYSFWLGMRYHTVFSFDVILRFITAPLIMYKRRYRGHPCRTPLDNGNGLDRKPLFEILDSVF